MPNTKIKLATPIINTKVLKSAAALPPPIEESLLDKETIKISRDLDRVLSRAGKNHREVKNKLDTLTAAVHPLPVRGGFVKFGAFATITQPIISLTEILN